MQPGHRYLSNLTPLRGVAALWVYIFHFHDTIAKYTMPFGSHLVHKGYIMVDLFFIMSGFIICHVYQASFQRGFQFKNFKDFTVARFARVYPLHFITLVMAIVLFVPKWGWDQVDDPHAIVTNVLLIHSFGIHKIFTWNVPSWSISAEWWAYMVFPVLVIFLYRKKNLAVIVLLAFVFLAYMGIIYWIPRRSFMDPNLPAPHTLDSTFDFGYLRGLAGFTTGMLLYKLYESELLKKIFRLDITAAVAILGTLFCLHKGIPDIYCIPLFALIVFTFANNNQGLHKICNYRFGQYIGNISYSIYLIQFFSVLPLFYFDVRLPGVNYAKDGTATTSFHVAAGYTAMFMVALIGLASLSYYFIEKPCRKYINARWGKQQMPVYA